VSGPVRAAVLLGLAALLALAAISAIMATTPVLLAAAAPLCDGTTALTPIGVDTASGRVLLSIPPLGGRGKGWTAELAADATEARAYPEAGGGRFGGSVGPGPVLAAQPCGGSCLQPVRWKDGAWEPLGEPLQVPAVNTATGTYDLAGSPWIVVQGKGDRAGQVKAWGFRLEGREWQLKGATPVTAAGDLAAVPAPQRKDGVLSGTGLFAASGPPQVWLKGLPALPPARQGQVVALGGGSAAYLSADGVVYLSPDDGKSWRRSTWTPWGGGTAGLWRQGTDYWVDLPVGDRRGPLQLAWFDRRTPGSEIVYLTRLGPGGAWTTLTQAKSEVATRSEKLPVSHIFAPREGTWLLLSGCVATAGGSDLVVRTYEKGTLSPPRLVPLREGKPAKGTSPGR
jgi:hypothetical protein